MSASFPNAKKTFSAVVNGVTKLVAALFNSPDDEIEAIETFVGATGGGAQAYSDSMTNLLYNYRQGCSVDYKSAADLYVRSGEIMVTDVSGNRRLRRNTADTTVLWSNIDVGVEATAMSYYLYAVADASATTFTVMLSTSATAPTGATFFKKLGSFYNDAAGDISYLTNTLTLKELSTVYDYGLGSSTFSPITGAAMKVCYGTMAIGANGNQAISNLPFLSATSYYVTVTIIETSLGIDQVPCVTKNSGAQFTLYNGWSAASIMWVAIGY
jgi:hypothetical protein